MHQVSNKDDLNILMRLSPTKLLIQVADSLDDAAISREINVVLAGVPVTNQVATEVDQNSVR